MENLTKTKLFELVCPYSEDITDPMEFDRAYEHFTALVCSNTFSEKPFAERYNSLTFALSHLHPLQEQLPEVYETKRNKELVFFFIRKAIFFLESQRNLLNLSLEYPNTLNGNHRTINVSPFKWSDKFSKQDLIELLTGLDLLGAVEDGSSGGKASFKSLVAGMELLFNIELPKSYRKREELLNRKIKTTNFIEKLKAVVIEKSQR